MTGTQSRRHVELTLDVPTPESSRRVAAVLARILVARSLIELGVVPANDEADPSSDPSTVLPSAEPRRKAA